MEISVSEIEARLPRPLAVDEKPRMEALIDDAVEYLEVEFQKCGRSLDAALARTPWLESVVRRVIREMVSAAVLIGPNVGVRSASSTTGPQSDSITFADVDSVGWGGVRLTDQQRLDLGLCMPGGARGKFPPPAYWPERIC
ncbi:phage Gp19/Gp15/Gp42 family protein [Corynebacterium phoceense]|uniref:phage Gp19/Gp15/Gp42 family protein n=1 Tax=Corynebacterium phoceense TaxID=1686286 RepID=UPI00211BDE01|nr:phage Gp19/Gp15/Gp42 family protein [Corynebacterium phoceense]MCQ9341334.1 phage Gp19/Gp15/Gp42 family protein [Corynebacterium phoceense]